MKRILLVLMMSVSFLFAAVNLNTATKDELMSVKGIGPKKADQIIKYRKNNKLNKPQDLKKIKGFGDAIVNNVKNDIKVSDKKMNKKKKKSEKIENKKEKKMVKKTKLKEKKANQKSK